VAAEQKRRNNGALKGRYVVDDKRQAGHSEGRPKHD
jgi:hypothetical protein